MDIFANVPPLFEPGQDLYRSLSPADAMDWHDRAFSHECGYNPAIPRAVMLLNKALNILRSM